jgi:hypothetical protein
MPKKIQIGEDITGTHSSFLPQEITPQNTRILLVGAVQKPCAQVYDKDGNPSRKSKGGLKLKGDEKAVIRIPSLGSPLEEDLEFLERAEETQVFREGKLGPLLLDRESYSIAHYVTLNGKGMETQETLYKKND